MSDLTEFLLARIAEDEAVARAWARAYNNPGSHPDYHYATMRRHRREWPVLWRSLDAYPPARVLAECEAKRRIVEEFEQVHADYRLAHTPTLEGQRLGLVKALTFLALPYVHHPDFREEWTS